MSGFGQKYEEEQEVKDNKVVESKMYIFCFMIFTSMYRAYKVHVVLNISSHLGSVKTYEPPYVYHVNSTNTKTPKVIETMLQGWALLNTYDLDVILHILANVCTLQLL